MHRSNQKDMLDDELEHPNDLIVSSKSKRGVLVDTDEGNAIFMTGDFSDTMEELEKEVRSAQAKWPFDRR